jgi:hypothetical protein
MFSALEIGARLFVLTTVSRDLAKPSAVDIRLTQFDITGCRLASFLSIK